MEISYWLDLFYYLCSMEQILREMIERMVGRKMVVPRDFVWLSEKVLERTRQRVSASTLRFAMFRVGIRDDLYIKIIYKWSSENRFFSTEVSLAWK